MSRAAYVYVIEQSGNGPVKVGISSNPESRLKAIQTGNPVIVDFAFVSEPMHRDIAKAIEAKAHAVFAESGMVGEWFSISAFDAVVSVQELIGREVH